jgi:cell division protein FtsQ
MWPKRNRRRQAKRSIKLPDVKINWARIVTGCAGLIVIGAVYIATLWAMDRPIDAVVINGSFQRVTADRFEEYLAPHIRTGFLSANLNGMQDDLLSIPWVAKASVTRRWPGTIEVTIQEQQAAACWGDSGLLNVDGDLFIRKASHIPAELPRLNGPDGTEARVAALYFRIEEQLEHRGMGAVSLSLNRRGAWEFELSSGIRVRLGSRLVERRLDRFFVALDHVVAARSDNVDYVDMRYTNGFAIGWKDQDSMRGNGKEGSKPHV